MDLKVPHPYANTSGENIWYTEVIGEQDDCSQIQFIHDEVDDRDDVDGDVDDDDVDNARLSANPHQRVIDAA